MLEEAVEGEDGSGGWENDGVKSSLGGIVPFAPFAPLFVLSKSLFKSQNRIYKKYDFKDYISSAGGFSDDARKNKAYILYANGKARTIRSFLFFKNYPTVKPGAEIVVPAKEERRNKLTTGEIIGISSALASLAGVAIAIINLTK